MAAATELLEQRLTGRLPELLLDVRDRLVTDWPDYAAFIDADLDEIRDGAGLFLHRLIMLATKAPSDGTEPLGGEQELRAVFERVGERQWELGHDLTRLLTAYQLGARVAWRYVADTAATVPVPADAVAALAESVFDFVNQLSQASAFGYVMAQRNDARARDRARDELAELLLSERATMASVRSAANRARWRLPRQVALVLAAGDGDLLGRLDADALPVRQGDLVGAIVTDPSGPGRERLARALRTFDCVVGPAVPVERLARSAQLAQIALGLARDGVLTGQPVFVDDHLDTLIVHRDDRLLSFLREQVLAPLDGLPRGSRDRLTETLASWLRHHGDRSAVATELHVHPQTVSYRVSRLRQLFGDALDSPRERARLFLALAWS